jgi:hypothetical protein
MPSDEKKDYEVGRGKPPLHTRFQKGKSGNPSGRPRGSKSTFTLLREVANEMVFVSENGRRRKITKLHAAMLLLINKAVSGDRRLMEVLLNELHLMEERAETASKAAPPVRPEMTTMSDTMSDVEYAREVFRILKEVGEFDEILEAERDQVEAKREEDEADKGRS